MPDRHRTGRIVATIVGTAVVLAVAFLLAPPMGTDLSAQVARADFFARHGYAPIDFGWYGGVNQFGYSLFTAALGAAFGVRLVGAVAAVVSAAALGYLLLRWDAHRPLLGGVLGAAVLVGNLVSGRITFAVGLAFALMALAVLSVRRRLPRGIRLGLAAVLAAVATWASPVAGLYVGVAGGALLLAALSRRTDDGWRLGRQLPESLVLCLAPAIALAPMALLFGNGGVQPFTAESMRINVALAVVVLLVLPRQQRVVRFGAALTALLLVLAYYLPSPIGSNAMRLPMLFAVPVLAAFATLDRRWLAALLAATVWWQPPVMTSDLGRMGGVEPSAAFYRPLLDELQRRGPVGRVEVVPLRDHWESTHVAAVVPLARGWERQVDVDRNPLFYRTGLSSDDYHTWLKRNAVSYVALASASPPDRYAREEAALVVAGTPYLREVWRDATWRLYAVVDAAPLVNAPGRLLESTQNGVRFHADGPGEVLVRLHWSRWLTLDGTGGCLAPDPEGWTIVRSTTAGEQSISSGLRPGPFC
ncbi:MFS transporter [Micromonospora polyrhachis]|uniref:MFS family permease n=1 Tax=Micromonospora polyrhachis TaxID=1282883 RepID=A0A7W7SUV9_9ACTN|nr:hypothetical protein [Micromonospora polyrhachis]MBB4961016.1 MFS family permease [Micromonospora polyrhachis]